MRPWIGLTLAAAAALGTPATATGAPPSVERLCDRAREAFAGGSDEKACEVLGEAAALAHRKGDLLGERRVGDALAATLGERTPRALVVRPGVERPPAYPRTRLDARDALAIVMAELDPDHAGAFVSAPSIARVLLLRATETGDDRYVEEAERVLGRFARAKKCGRGAGALARYAEGMVALREDGAEEAAPLFQAALDTAVENRWPDLAAHLSVEAAAALAAIGSEDEAVAAVSRAAALFDEAADPSVGALWKTAATRRLSEAPAALAVVVEAVAPLATGGNGGIPLVGGATMDGINNLGGRKSTDLGKAFPRLSSRSPLVTVERGDRGFDIRMAFAPKESPFQAWRPGEHGFAHEGLALAFAGGAVALEGVDLENQLKSPSVRLRPALARAWYLLGPGETLAVTKTGRVSITE